MNDNEDSDTDRDEQIFKLTDALPLSSCQHGQWKAVILCIFYRHTLHIYYTYTL